MFARILVVEDHADLLFNELLILELNGYQGFGAENGRDALDKLQTMESPPDLIISDILMPIMSGYDFYQEVSKDTIFSKIPFIFLTAKSSPEDVRFARYLGVNDYITKPFTEEKLLEIIKLKLLSHALQQTFQHNIDEKLESKLSIPLVPSEFNGNSVFILVKWDDIQGPQLAEVYPKNFEASFSPEMIATQLFDVSVGLYGQHRFQGSADVLLTIANIAMDGYIYFDGINNKKYRGGVQSFMLGLISPKIHYLASLRIKEIFGKMAGLIKANEKYDIEQYWSQIGHLLLLSK